MILKRREKKVNSVLSTHGKLCSALPHFLLLRHLVTLALKPWLWLRRTVAAGGPRGHGQGAGAVPRHEITAADHQESPPKISPPRVDSVGVLGKRVWASFTLWGASCVGNGHLTTSEDQVA